eukprot:CAMPEP_0203784018 /NCGR_PEP_ID=MMETSP0100_2-20121128/232_1 /ASSEMBLY_ACC=CAM_ASM_000210 /TAXON_ID=96639 /ORGANISM=" , Strain NY0313808BC1" /LENGTH=441 /DNA_ID=CAMNT_0050685951 /DNA_START=1 /DNA_END=1327 /DNA_ORIENTATION=+
MELFRTSVRVASRGEMRTLKSMKRSKVCSACGLIHTTLSLVREKERSLEQSVSEGSEREVNDARKRTGLPLIDDGVKKSRKIMGYMRRLPLTTLGDADKTDGKATAIRFRGKVRYIGARFHGFQRQIDNQWCVPTAQSYLEEAISKAFGLLEMDKTVLGIQSTIHDPARAMGPCYGFETPLIVDGSSRTDVGVNAFGQLIHVDIPSESVKTVWGGKEVTVLSEVNNILKDKNIELLEFLPTKPEFDAHKVKGKRYRYTLYDGVESPPPFRHLYWDIWGDKIRKYRPGIIRRLDVGAMDKTAKGLAGGVKRNFRLFTRSQKRTNSTIETSERTKRTLWTARVFRSKIADVHSDSEHEPEGDFVHFYVSGGGFLFLMVRCIMTALIQVGNGKLGCEQVLERLNPPSEEEINKNQNILFAPARAEGLILDEVFKDSSVESCEDI